MVYDSELGSLFIEEMQSKGLTAQEIAARAAPLCGAGVASLQALVTGLKQGKYLGPTSKLKDDSRAGLRTKLDRVSAIYHALRLEDDHPLVLRLKEREPEFTYSASSPVPSTLEEKVRLLPPADYAAVSHIVDRLLGY